MKIISLILNNSKISLIILLIILSGVIYKFAQDNKNLKIENTRISKNFEQINLDHVRELTLTKWEIEKINTRWKNKLDSVLKAEKIKLRNVQTAEIINTIYRDTGSTKIVYKLITKSENAVYTIPFEVKEPCWGVYGMIASKDSTATIHIKEKTAFNSVQLLVYKKGILWWRKYQFKAFNDCGTVDVTKVNFK